MFSTTASHRRAFQSGMSLVEVLVGVAVGMIGILVIFQTVVVWDKHTQTTNAGGDAQVAGTLAMFNLERDIKLAGFGFGTAATPVMGCTVQATDTNPPRVVTFPMSPVRISPGASGAADSIDVLHGNSAFFVTTETFSDSTPTTKQLKRRGGFKAGDLAVVAGNASASAASANCQLVEITDASNADGVTVAHAAGSYTSFYAASAVTARFNPSTGTGTVFTGGTIYNLGPLPQRNRWEVTNQALTSTDLIHGAAAFEVAEGVVDLKAEYGVDANLDGTITAGEWTTAEPTDWRQVLAIRVGLLVRSRQYEKTGDTPFASGAASSASAPSAPTWFGTEFTMTNVDGSTDSFNSTTADPNNWRYYRYRVYERVIPLRNMIWGTLIP